MAALSVFYRDKRRSWYASIGGKQVRVPRDIAANPNKADERKALRWATEKAAEQERHAEREPTISELAEGFKAAAVRASPATRAEYSSHLALSILPAFGAVGPADLTIPRLRAWVRELGRKLARQTVSNRLATLSKLVSWARAEGLTTAPNNAGAREVRAELPEAPMRAVSVLEPEQAIALLACERVPAVRRMRAFVAAWGGLEAGTVAALRLEDLELTRGAETLKVERSAALRGPNGHASMKGPKNRHRHRAVPVHPALAGALRWWVAEGRRGYLGEVADETDLLFPSARGRASRPKAGVQLRHDLALAGVTAPAGSCFKMLRATFATWLTRAGVDEGARARLMGHAGKTTAEKFYTGQVDAALRSAVRLLPSAELPEASRWLNMAQSREEGVPPWNLPLRGEGAPTIGDPIKLELGVDLGRSPDRSVFLERAAGLELEVGGQTQAGWSVIPDLSMSGLKILQPLSRYRDDPVGFAEEVLGATLWHAQASVLRELAKEGASISVSTGHKTGMTFALAVAALWFWATRQHGRTCLLGGSLEEVQHHLWPEIVRLYAMTPRLGAITWLDPTDARAGLRSPDGRVISSATGPDVLEGLSGPELLFLGDQASRIPQALFEAMRGNEVGGCTRKMIVSRPGDLRGEFYESQVGQVPYRAVFRVSSRSTPNARCGFDLIPGLASARWCAERDAEWGADSEITRRLLDGEFPDRLQHDQDAPAQRAVARELALEEADAVLDWYGFRLDPDAMRRSWWSDARIALRPLPPMEAPTMCPQTLEIEGAGAESFTNAIQRAWLESLERIDLRWFPQVASPILRSGCEEATPDELEPASQLPRRRSAAHEIVISDLRARGLVPPLTPPDGEVEAAPVTAPVTGAEIRDESPGFRS